MSGTSVRIGLSHRRAIIVGAGQAGLAVAAALISRGLSPQRDFVVVDQSPGVRSWETRWTSLTLLSDVRHSTLPALSFPSEPQSRPRAREVAAYLGAVEKHLGIAPMWGVRATGVRRLGSSATLLLETSTGSVQTRNVVCATGANSRPRLPAWAGDIAPPGRLMHSSAYRSAADVPLGDVLIVGGGNAGAQIARELSGTHRVTLAVRNPRRYRHVATFPRAAGPRKRLGSIRPEPLFGDGYAQLQRDGIDIVPAVVGASDADVTLADGRRLAPASVILATGFLPGDDWLPAEVRDAPLGRTRTSVPGLFVAGMPGYGHPGSENLDGVWRDAATIARHIANRP